MFFLKDENIVPVSVKLLKYLGILTLSTQEYSFWNWNTMESSATVEKKLNCMVYIFVVGFSSDFDFLLKLIYNILLPGCLISVYIQISTENKWMFNWWKFYVHHCECKFLRSQSCFTKCRHSLSLEGSDKTVQCYTDNLNVPRQ